MQNTSNKNIPSTYWITGLSGAGKSTLLPHVVEKVNSINNTKCIFFDGDDLRYIINIKTFDVRSRIENGLRYGKLCKYLNEQGHNVVIACIGLYQEIHDWNKKNIPSLKYILLDVPVDELIKRDPKGIYKKGLDSKVSNIVGIDIPAIYPDNPNIHFKWKINMTKEKMIEYCISKINN